MLMAWNDAHTDQYVLPENVPANEFLNFEGQKFSKSRGWGIDVQDFLKFFPADMLRYALAVNLPETRDSDFYLKDFQARINNELADIVGNFINRTLAFTDKNFNGKIPPLGKLNARDEEMIDILKQTPVKAGELFEQYRFREGLMEIMNFARAANKYFNDHEPWKTLKSNPERCATTLHIAIQIVRSLAILLEPVTPALSSKIWILLNLDGASKNDGWDSASDLKMKDGHQLNKPEILIHKIEDKQIDEIMKFLEGEEKPGATLPLAPTKPTITLDDFKKIDLRVARVLEVEKVPKSEKLLKLQVEIGNERRQIVAGIAKQYKPEDLIGMLIVVVANLQPAKLMGQESQGMILAAGDESGNLTLAGVRSEISTGATVK
jgi:methionyl-tRNA synthetase